MVKIILIFSSVIFLSCSTNNQADKFQAQSVVLKYPESVLLDTLQEQTFNYFWKGGEPISGAARERFHLDDIYPHHAKDIVTSGGTGFGIMATLAAVNRKFITREAAYQRLNKLVLWLEKADRHHGAWPHWMTPDGSTKPFSKYDDGGDLVETAFLAQGLIAARQFFQKGNAEEKLLAQKMDLLWKGIDWNWYTKGESVLYWHWSPVHEWKMNFAVRGYNECLIMYFLAAASPSYPIDAKVFHEGFMKNGEIVTDRKMYDIPTILDHYDTNNMAVGPLFWSHYSFLGLNPNGLKDKYADYWKLCENHAKIHHQHAIKNPNQFKGYSEECWGLTSSYSIKGYAGHNPEEDLGVISPTAALSSFPYTPAASSKFLRFLYEKHPEYIGEYGPYDAFSFEADWTLPRYLAIDQLPIPVMIENYRSQFIWDLFMSAPEVQVGLEKLGMNSNPK